MDTSVVTEEVVDFSSSPELKVKMLALARKVFTDHSSGDLLRHEAAQLATQPVERVVVVVTGHRTGLLGSGTTPVAAASWEGLGQQILYASHRAREKSEDFLASFGATLDADSWFLELWLQTGSLRLDLRKMEASHQLLPKNTGVEVRRKGRTAFCKPGLATDYHGRELIPILESLCAKLGQPPDAWREQDVECRLSSWIWMNSDNDEASSETAAAAFHTSHLDQQIKNRLLLLARHTLEQLFHNSLSSPPGELEAIAALPCAERVNVTLRRGNQIRGSMSAKGVTLFDQIVSATRQAALDDRFGGPIRRWELSAARIEVWLQTASEEIPHAMRNSAHAMQMGHEGVEIRTANRFAYYKPSVAVTSKHKSQAQLFRALCRKARLGKDAWQDATVGLRRTHWVVCSSVAAIEPNVQPHSLMDETSEWIRNSTRYLIENQDCSGNTAYLYDPVRDVTLLVTGNRVRASGCLFALSQVLHSPIGDSLDAVTRAGIRNMATGLLGNTVVDRAGRRVVDTDKRGESPKLGATALLASALSFTPLREDFPIEFQELHESVAAAQLPSGRFTTRMDGVTENHGEVNYFPGQALLLLALEAERGNSAARLRCEQAFTAYRDHFRAGPTSAFVGWQVDVWARLGSLTADRRYIDFAFEQVDWLLQMQILDHRDPRYVGGFATRGRVPKYSSIVFAEAVARGLALALTIGDAERIERYTRSVRLGVKFIKQLRLEDVEASLLAAPERCRGGIALELLDLSVRCDVVQHFITFCLVLQSLQSELESQELGLSWWELGENAKTLHPVAGQWSGEHLC